MSQPQGQPFVVPTPPPIGTCSGCRFWEAPDVTLPGRCHFSAPPIAAHVQQNIAWPMTDPNDWCGQFVART